MFGSRDWDLDRWQPYFSPADGDGGGDGGGAGSGKEDDGDPLANLDDKAKAAIEARIKDESTKAAAAARRDAEKTAKTLQDRLTAIENSGKTEAEKTAARLKELEDANAEKAKQLRDRDAKDTAREAAKKAGSNDPDLVYRAIRSDIDFDEDGKPTNIAGLITDLKELSPQLFKPVTSKIDGGSGNGSKPNAKRDFMREAANAKRGG